MRYRDTVIKTARGLDPRVRDLQANVTWQRIKVHSLALEQYVGRRSGGLEKLRDEIHAENHGITVPLAARWLGKVQNIKERWQLGKSRHLQRLLQSMETFHNC
jgi:hypothetical protein